MIINGISPNNLTEISKGRGILQNVNSDIVSTVELDMRHENNVVTHSTLYIFM